MIAQGDPNEKTRYFFIYTGQSSGWMGIQISSLPLVSLGIGRDHYLTREQVAEAVAGNQTGISGD